MTVSHSAEDAILGGERRTDGLWVHKGKLSVGAAGNGAAGSSLDAPRRAGDINAHRGDGTGVYYFGGRSDKYLYFDGTNFALQGGQLNVSGGLTPGLATTALGNYRALTGYTPPATGQWSESPAQVSATTAGGRIRCDGHGALIGSTVGTAIFVGLMIDGATSLDSLVAGQVPVANYFFPFAFTCYVTPAAGLRRFAIGLYVNALGSGFYNGAYTHLWITEQKA